MNYPPPINERLSQVELFRGLTKRQLRRISCLGTQIEAEPGVVLTREGQPGGEFILVFEGNVEVRSENRVLATRGPGDHLGEIALLGTQLRTATVVAKTPLVIDVLSRREFWTLLEEVPELSDSLRATMTDRLTELATTTAPCDNVTFALRT